MPPCEKRPPPESKARVKEIRFHWSAENLPRQLVHKLASFKSSVFATETISQDLWLWDTKHPYPGGTARGSSAHSFQTSESISPQPLHCITAKAELSNVC